MSELGVLIGVSLPVGGSSLFSFSSISFVFWVLVGRGDLVLVVGDGSFGESLCAMDACCMVLVGGP